MSAHKPIIIRENITLQPYNTFGINVSARYFTHISSPCELYQLLAHTKLRQQKKMVLGGGSNLLFTQDYSGLILLNTIPGISLVKEDNNHVWLRIGAGENWHQLVMYCVKHNLAGVENLSLIPGSVGAAPIQNIGAYGVELKQVFTELEAIHLNTGELERFDKTACQFGYRHSIFKTKYKNQFMITHVTLKLNKQPDFYISYGAIQKMLDKMNVKNLTIKAISDAVIQIRRNKLPDPNELGNAGSFFKNPEITPQHLQELLSRYPDIPHYATTTEKIKISAAWLIEQCGWKGKRCGKIGVHDRQALVIVNYGGGTGEAVKMLAKQIQAEVYNHFSVKLIPEVNIIT